LKQNPGKRMKKFSFLLPGSFRSVGIVLTGIGIIILIVRFYYGVKPGILNMKTFAIFSSYLESKYFEVVKNQMIEEIGGVILMAGLFMLAFSKEKDEHDHLNTLRLQAFFITAYINTFFLIISILFTFGFGFVYIMILNFVLGFIIYLLSFRILIYRYYKNRKKE